MIFLDPITSIRDEKFAHRLGVWSVEINRIAPIVFVFARQIIARINGEIIPIRAEVVVNHIENHSKVERMRAIDEAAQIVRRAV